MVAFRWRKLYDMCNASEIISGCRLDFVRDEFISFKYKDLMYSDG